MAIIELAATEEDYGGGQLKAVAKYVAGRQGELAAEAQAWKEEQFALAASGEYFFSLNRYLFVARRPA
jgi:arsenite methyltransferase